MPIQTCVCVCRNDLSGEPVDKSSLCGKIVRAGCVRVSMVAAETNVGTERTERDVLEFKSGFRIQSRVVTVAE